MRDELYVVNSKKVGPFRVEVVSDPYPENPATGWDWPGMAMCVDFGRDGEIKTPNVKHLDPRKFLELIEGKDEYGEDDKSSEFYGWIVRPVFAYIHSGVTISLGAFSCPWDSGCAGFIAMQPDHEDWKGKTEEEKIKYMENMVETVDNYLTGQVFAYRVIREVDEEEVDSCWGFNGDDKYAMEAGVDSAESQLRDHGEFVEAHAVD